MSRSSKRTCKTVARQGRYSLVLLLAGAHYLGGCSDTEATQEAIVLPTLVAVAPEDFSLDMPCQTETGSAERYVATLYDVEGEEELDASGEALVSSEPISCLQAVGFTGSAEPTESAPVELNHWYVAEVDLYDATDLEPLEPGSRTMLDPDTQETIAPLIVLKCGRQTYPGYDPEESVDWSRTGAALAVPRATQYVRNCSPR